MSQKFTEDEVKHTAMLSRLKLTEEQVHTYSEQLSSILGYVEQLSELDVENVEPMAHPTDMINVFRHDEPGTPLTAEKALENAPDADPPFFKVPKVIGDGGGA